MDNEVLPDLFSEPLKQEAWYKQVVQDISTSKRPIDKMSIAEVRNMYQQHMFLCDSCGKALLRGDFTLEEHIIHMINPSYHWSCEDCFQDDLRNNRIIAMTDENPPEKWQVDYT